MLSTSRYHQGIKVVVTLNEKDPRTARVSFPDTAVYPKGEITSLSVANSARGYATSGTPTKITLTPLQGDLPKLYFADDEALKLPRFSAAFTGFASAAGAMAADLQKIAHAYITIRTADPTTKAQIIALLTDGDA